MNISGIETPLIVDAKICGCSKRNIAYSLFESPHSLCIDKREILLAQLQACERLLKHANDTTELSIIKNGISALKSAFDMSS